MKRVLSLFNGMGCGQIALTELNIKHQYYYSEVDKFVNKVQELNFQGSIPLGDVKKWKEWDIDWDFDLIMGGSPCQGFSFAGKQLNFSDERSKLFFEFVDILNHVKKVNPEAKFLLENVPMKKEYLRIISEYLGIFPVLINSALVSAQNRKRWYWTNIMTKEIGLFDELWTDIPQPEDKGIYLKDILQPESEVDEKYYLKDVEIERAIKKHSSQVWHTGSRNGNVEFPTNINGKAKTLITLQITGDRALNHIWLNINKKAPTLRSSTGRCLDDKHNYQIIGVVNDNGKLKESLKSNCIDSNYSKRIDNNQQRTGVLNGKKIRRLTPLECQRLQTVPEWFNWGNTSDSQKYKMLGNGWTVEVIKHILSYWN